MVVQGAEDGERAREWGGTCDGRVTGSEVPEGGSSAHRYLRGGVSRSLLVCLLGLYLHVRRHPASRLSSKIGRNRPLAFMDAKVIVVEELVDHIAAQRGQRGVDTLLRPEWRGC